MKAPGGGGRPGGALGCAAPGGGAQPGTSRITTKRIGRHLSRVETRLLKMFFMLFLGKKSKLSAGAIYRIFCYNHLAITHIK